MTTPTREQVNKLLEMIQRHFPSLPMSDAYTNWKQWSEFAQAAFSFGADEARADLEATIAEQAAEIERLKSVTHVSIPTNTMEQWAASEIRIATQKLCQQLAAQQAYAEQLRGPAESVCASLEHPTESVNALQMWKLRDALAIPYDTTAQQEYGAKLVEPYKKDADRYRWLRDVNDDPELYLLTAPEELDVAIDAAMKENEQ